MKPIPLKFPPGMWRNGTDYESAGRWYDGNLVRWEDGRLKPWGGWRSVLESTMFSGIPRGGITWRSALGYRYAAIGTHTNLYLYEDGSYTDVTPNTFVAGRPDAIEGPGYGAGPYGEETYGTQRTVGAVGLDATYWSFDVFGETLFAVASSDGVLYSYVPGSGVEPAAVTNAPGDNVGVLVTDEGHVMALGADGDRRVVAWCSQGAVTTWTPASTNSAGDRTLKTGGQIKGGRIFNGVPMIFTDTDLHAMPYAGLPLVYNNNKVGDACGIAGPNAHGATHDMMFWMGVGGFFTYDGVVRQLPCDLHDWLFGSEEQGITPAINLAQRTKITCGINSKFNEVTWFFPSFASTENDLYITYNYKDKIWYKGELERTVWLDRGVFQLPLACDASGVLYEHEVTYLDDGATRTNIFAQSGPMEIGDGERVIVSNNMIPDAKNPENFTVEFVCKTAPQGTSQTYGPYSMEPNAEGFASIMITGRQIAMRVEQIADGDWSIGRTRIMATNGGKR